MSVSRSLGSLVIRIAAEGIGAYKSDLNAAADATSQAAGKMETSANRAVNAAKNMGGGLGQAAQGAEVVMAAAGGAGLAVGVLAAGFGLAAVAAYQGAKEKQAYAKSLILTGNAAGVTTGQLADMAKGISSSVGTTGQAAAALAAMAGSGAVAGGSLQKFSQVAVEMERTVGTKVADTVKQFEALGDAPVAASIKLNQSMNYLTASTFAQIKAAQELGDMESAASIAQNAYANAVTQRVAAVEGTLGTLQKAWRGAGEAAKWAWDKMMNLGREQGPEQALAAQRTTVQNLEAQLARGGLGTGGIDKQLSAAREALGIMQENVKLSQRSATLQAEKAATEKAGIAGVMAVTAANTKALDKQEQMNRALGDYSKSLAAIKEADPASKLLKPELIAKTEAAIRAQFADKGGRGGSNSAAINDEFNSQIVAIKKAQELEQSLTKATVDKVNSERKRGMVNDLDYINQVAEAEKKALASSVTALEQEKDIAAQKKNSKTQVAALEGSIAAAKEKLHSRELAQGYAVLELQDKLVRENIKNNADIAESEDRKAVALQSQVQAEKDSIAAMGLSASALAELAAAKLNDTAASKDRLSSLFKEIDPAIAAGYKDQASALRGLAAAKIESQAKSAYQAVEKQLIPDFQPQSSNGEGDRIVGEESKKQAAYNATARSAIDAYVAIAEAQLRASEISGTATQKQIDDLAALSVAAEAMKDKMSVAFESSVKVDGLDNISKQFDLMSKSAGGMGEGFKKAQTALNGFSSAFKTLANAEKNTKADTKERVQAQVGGYAEMAGAAKGFFEENSDGYKLMTAIEQGFRAFEMASSLAAMVQKFAETTNTTTLNGVEAASNVMVGGSKMFAQSGWAAFVGVAAMLAVMASLGFGGGGGGAGGTAGPGNQIGSDGRRARDQGVDSSQGVEGGATNYDPNTGGYTLQNKPQLTDAEVKARADAAAIDAAANAVANLRIEAMKLTKGSEELELSLARAKLAAGGMGRAQHELATQGMNEAELASYNYNQALLGQISVQMDIANGTNNTSDNMRKLAQESESLAIELLMASGDIAAARAMQREVDTRGYTSTEVAMYDHNQATRDAIAAANAGAAAAREAAQAEEALARTRYELAGRLDVLLGRRSQLEVDRAAELLNVTDEAVLSLLKMVHAIEDLRSAVDKSFAALQRAVEAERKTISEAYKTAFDTRTASLKQATDLFNALKSTLGTVEQGMTREQAKDQLDATLNMARMTGMLPTAESMSGGLKALSANGESSFKTATEFKLDQAKTAAKLAELAKMAGSQTSLEQRSLDQLKMTYDAEMKRLDDVLSVAQKQLDKLNGIDTSVISVADAVKGFDKSLIDLAKAIKDAPVNNVAAPAPGGGGGGGGSGGGGGGTGTNPDIDPPKLPDYDISSWKAEIIKGYLRYYNRYPDPSGYEHFDKTDLHGDKLLQAILGASAIDKEGVDYKRAVKRGYNPLDPIAKFAIGTNYVPNDMFAMVHQGERIIPAAENRELFSRLSNPQQNNAELVTELRAIRQELAIVKTELTQIKESNKKMKDLAEKDDAIGSAPARAVL